MSHPHPHPHPHPLLDFTVDALAVYRITRLVTEDTILAGPRDRLVMSDTTPAWVTELISCHHCVSQHAGIAVSFLRRVTPRAWRPVAYALALSAVTSLKTELTESID